MATEASKALFNEQIDQICEQMGVKRYDAFPIWVCQNVFGITNEGRIDEAVSIGGKNDYGIDIFHSEDSSDVTEQGVLWARTKFSETLDHRVTREEIESFAGTLGHLRNCPGQANATFKQKAAEFAHMEAENPQITKQMIFVVAGRINDQVRDLISDPQWRRDRIGSGPNIRFDVLDLDDILSRMTISNTPALTVRFEGDDTIERAVASTGKKSILGYVSASSLVSLSKEHRDTIFLENPRQTLGKTAPTHKAIIDALGDGYSRETFWRLNNGITAICTSFDAVGDDSTYRVEDFKIVNGRQTTYSLEKSTDPIDGVFVQMTIHEAVDDRERNHISEATNTQNPIKPADLVTNYREMTDLVLQCRRGFPEFYFERQTRGFSAAKKSTQNRVTSRRVMEKGSVARAYYGYAIDPAEATMPDRMLFSVTGEPNHYETVFKDRNIEDLIIPHIFMVMLDELHRKWCREIRDNPSGETLRNKGIISKDLIKYHILSFVYESMMGIDESARGAIKGNMIGRFRRLKKDDPLPRELLDIAQDAYDVFMFSFDSDRNETWPRELRDRISQDGYKERENDVPTPLEVMDALKQRGDRILPHLRRMRKHVTRQNGDRVRDRLLELEPPTD